MTRDAAPTHATAHDTAQVPTRGAAHGAACDPRHAALFEPIRLGPVTAPNRFYQVPHCTGMGWLRPQTLAEMRALKAEGGWGVVCTEYCSIHPASDDLSGVSAALWDEDDLRAHALMTEKVHAHGSLAGVELWFGGRRNTNAYSRLATLDVDCVPNGVGHPWQTRAMDRTDIADLRRWHRKAALRAREAGFDIVYVYATHEYLLANFLDPRRNTRTDEYGGCLENRVRLVRELIEETKEAVGDTCAVAARFSTEEGASGDGVPGTGERREMFAMLAELPDLWDVNVADYSLEMGLSRFTAEGALEPHVDWVKQATTKPVVTVGRYTSPDAMAALLRRGIADLVGAARPSIADPFLPTKIREGRIEDIRECIGCNVCYSGDSLGVPIRCTQNPTMGEEWRRGWHPERIAARGSEAHVLVVGAGPAGLEAARALGQRGYRVTLAEATRELGGRVAREARLPGMGAYARVRDHRVQQLHKLTGVEVYLESRLTAEDVLDLAPDHVALATGADWRAERFDGARFVALAAPGAEGAVFTPDAIMEGRLPAGPVVIFDQEGYYMAAVVAERLCTEGLAVTLVTEADRAAPWGDNTGEGGRVRRRLVALGVDLVTAHGVTRFDGASAGLACVHGGPGREIACAALVAVTARVPRDGLYRELLAREGPLPFTLARIGDCEAPGIVAQAVYAGHAYARDLEAAVDRDRPLRHERVALAPAPASREYLDTLLLYYEEEIMGEAYFEALAERFETPAQRDKLRLLAEVERRAAAHVRPLIARHALVPRPRATLHALGAEEAAREPGDWGALLDGMRRTYPGYVADFTRLEAMAPAIDRGALARLTAHETAAIAFLDAEAGADTGAGTDSTAALRRYVAAE